MRKRFFTILALSIISMVGCGPMANGPMPARLEADSQKKIDDTWEKALTPVDHLDHQAVLDTLVMTQAFQAGVDRLEFRSEKKFSGGMVVMEIHFDRAKPNDDRFEVTINDPVGKVLRHLVYHRSEIEATCRELHDPRYGDQPPPNQAVDPKKREEVQKRLKVVEQLFPKEEEPKPAK